MKGYLANGLFSLGDRMVNELVASIVRKEIKELDLYLPQENEAINDKNSYANSVMIAEGDDSYLENADFMIAIIDGIEIDSGVACEIGDITRQGKPVFALFTDVRQLGRTNPKKIEALIEDGLENQFIYRNLYVVGKIKKSQGGIYHTIEELTLAIKKHFNI